MAYVITRTGKDGAPRFTGVYRDLTGRAYSAGTFTTEARALREATNAEADASAGRGFDPRRARQTLRHYVETEWLPHHMIEASTRESYLYLLGRYIYPDLGDLRMRDIQPTRVRTWVTRLSEVHGANPPTIRNAKVVLDAIFTTALNDQVVPLHPGRGVKTPAVARKPRRIITAEQFQHLHDTLPDPTMRLLVETDIESGLRWGELTELRARDLDIPTGMLTIARTVIHLRSATRPSDARFLVKDYPKDAEWRQVKLAAHLVAKLDLHITAHQLGSEDLLFPQPQPTGPARRRRPDVLPHPSTLGRTEPNANGRSYPHGTLTAYQAGRCRCIHCRDAVAAYRAARRAAGKDTPRTRRTIAGDGHLSNDWFRAHIWKPALEESGLGLRITPHGLRHAHASWLLAGGADLQVVKERLGHGSITTTERYLHTLPNAHDSALAALDAVRPRHTAVNSTAPDNADDRDAELARLREAVAQFKTLFDSLAT
jgi:integrase